VREWLVGNDQTGKGTVMQGPLVAQGLPTLEAARDAVPPFADCLIPRRDGNVADTDVDDPTIVETWM
jgi:hypothetical protein